MSSRRPANLPILVAFCLVLSVLTTGCTDSLCQSGSGSSCGSSGGNCSSKSGGCSGESTSCVGSSCNGSSSCQSEQTCQAAGSSCAGQPAQPVSESGTALAPAANESTGNLVTGDSDGSAS